MSYVSHQSGLGTKGDSDSSATTNLYFLERKKTRTDNERCRRMGTAVRESCSPWHKSHVNRLQIWSQQDVPNLSCWYNGRGGYHQVGKQQNERACLQPQPSSGNRFTELSWLQQQGKLLHGMLAQRPLALSGTPLTEAAHGRPLMCLQKEPRECYPCSWIKSLHRSRHPHSKETSRASIEKLWATQLCQGTGFYLQVSPGTT